MVRGDDTKEDGIMSFWREWGSKLITSEAKANLFTRERDNTPGVVLHAMARRKEGSRGDGEQCLSRSKLNQTRTHSREC